MDGTDPAKQQYYIFSLIVAFILSFILNFFFVELLEGSFLYGFPFDLSDTSGITSIIYRSINTVIYGLVLSVAVYYGIMWLANRTRY